MRLSTRAEKAMRAVDRIDSPKFKNDSPEDFQAIVKGGRLLMLRNVGEGTAEELSRAVKIKK